MALYVRASFFFIDVAADAVAGSKLKLLPVIEEHVKQQILKGGSETEEG